ncbi:hypothetical protein BDP27DRAFT_1381742 [Rhodocollybia butyracea]|uniref:Transposase domain-containing protein n=1 Tax=Rhodocollybia butyracea TaxID=206335 RepID=A0A9P5Q4G9_9AGAR|nr:hypothetical protein BDP27DRAFT_1381742 [Rhodocollybia butyracea]
MSDLAEVEVVWYDCCVKSCLAFTGEHADLDHCVLCDEPRKDAHGKSCWCFGYIPLIPHLKGLYESEHMANLMLYCHNFKASTTSISDVFNANGYHQLLDRKVKVDGYKHDVALSVFVDTYTVFCRNHCGPSATLILIKNLNLPPKLHILSENILPLGLIPGKPKDLGSYLHPYQEELVDLAHGVETYCAKCGLNITLHAYSHLTEGDICAIEAVLNLMGTSSFSPCRCCEIKEPRDLSLTRSPYYYPLRQPQQNEDECQHHGCSSPHKWMHMFENIVPNLILLWKGKFKGIHGDYEIDTDIWEQIGHETVNAIKDIPSAFVLYYYHACGLKNIMFTSIKFTITRVEIENLRKSIIKWVHEYERLYFHYDPKRLPVCTLTVHIIVHLPDNILFCGPSWSTWTFWGERFCGLLQTQVSSHLAPFANLTNCLIYAAYVTQY